MSNKLVKDDGLGIIKVTLKFREIVFHQLNNDPLLRDDTVEILKEASRNKQAGKYIDGP